MPKLDPKKEAFAQALALGTTLREAARRSGYAHGETNKAYLSRLSKKPDVAARIEEIKRDRAIAFHESDAGQVLNSDASLAELGFTEDWILQSYLAIHKAAMEAGSYPAANVALKGVVNLVRKRDEALEKGEDQPAQGEGEKIKTSDLIAFLGDMKAAMDSPEPETGPSQVTVNNLRHRHDN